MTRTVSACLSYPLPPTSKHLLSFVVCSQFLPLQLFLLFEGAGVYSGGLRCPSWDFRQGSSWSQHLRLSQSQGSWTAITFLVAEMPLSQGTGVQHGEMFPSAHLPDQGHCGLGNCIGYSSNSTPPSAGRNQAARKCSPPVSRIRVLPSKEGQGAFPSCSLCPSQTKVTPVWGRHGKQGIVGGYKLNTCPLPVRGRIVQLQISQGKKRGVREMLERLCGLPYKT